jgi:hypothetical protein
MLLFTQLTLLQVQAIASQPEKIHKRISFQTTIDIKHATKDGIYLNGYVVNIPFEQLTKLNGKTVCISGKVTIVKGIKYFPEEALRQGRYEDAKHIYKPKIKVI